MNLDNFLYSLHTLIKIDISTQEDAILFLNKLKYRKVKKNDYILKEGNICRSVFFVDKGIIRSSVITTKGSEITTSFFQENDYISEYKSFLKNIPSTCNIQALEDSILIELTKDTIEWSYENTSIGNLIGRKIIEQCFLQVVERKNSMLIETPTEQYMNLIKKNPNIHNKIHQKYIASYLGITPVHLSRLKAQKEKFWKV